MPLRIVADENIPLLDPLFAPLGEVVRVPGRAITPALLRDADLLLVRSLTRVDAELVRGSSIKFVGSATIGVDHLDCEPLRQLGIEVANAPGCNARAVAEYLLSLLLTLREAERLPPQPRVAVVGLGSVGQQLCALLRTLGWPLDCVDPYRPDLANSDLDAAMQADVITLHTPLTRQGDHPTWHLFDAARLARLHDGQLLINSGRGAVIDHQALLARLQQPRAPSVALDVWEGEPNIDPALLDRLVLGTPHIAGHSLEGKMRGAWQLRQAVGAWLELPPLPPLDTFLPPPLLREVTLAAAADPLDLLLQVMRLLYDIRLDDWRLRRALAQDPSAATFDRLRKHYPGRREFASLRLRLPAEAEATRALFAALGFAVV